MPRKAKDKVEKNEKIEKKKSSSNSKKTTTAKKSTVTDKKENSVKKSAGKKTSPAKTKKDVSEKATSSTVKKKTTVTKNSTTTKSANTKKKAVTSKATKSNTSTKEATPTKTTRKRTTKKAAKSAEEPITPIIEYYDLPYKYGNTIIRLLAQTPRTLFVYWEVSDNDIENFKKIYGDDFFAKTKPILIVHNLTLNKITEIEINDFANCWYLNCEDSDCKYDIELARKFIDNSSEQNENSSLNEHYLHIATSNNLQSPNNHILFEKIQEFVVFKDTENDKTIKKNIKSFKFLENIYKFYKEMYDESVFNNPSSQFKF